MLGDACAVCMTPERARALACEPWLADRPAAPRTAAILVPYMSAGIGPRRVIEFGGPVIVLGVHVSAIVPHPEGGIADMVPMLLARLDTDRETRCITAGARNEAPFVALASLDVRVRALDLVLEGAHPELGVTLRPLADDPDGPEPGPLPVVMSFIFRGIGWE